MIAGIYTKMCFVTGTLTMPMFSGSHALLTLHHRGIEYTKDVVSYHSIHN